METDPDRGHLGGSVPEADARAMVRLLGEIAASPGDHATKKRDLMEGLCKLVGAVHWVWALSSSLSPGEQPVYITVHNGGFTADQFGRFMKAVDHSAMGALTAPFARELAQKRTHLTRRLQDVDTKLQIFEGDIGELWRAANIGPITLSYRPIDEQSYSCVALYRRWGAPLFSAREARIAHIVLTEVPWLHQQGWPKDRGSTVPILAPRQRTVLNLLIRGLSRKEISGSLEISEHTTNDYVKSVYRHFQVNSQAQLVSRFLRGDGGDLRT
jgi:DNA-binding CsgD family transcriptional regulator